MISYIYIMSTVNVSLVCENLPVSCAAMGSILNFRCSEVGSRGLALASVGFVRWIDEDIVIVGESYWVGFLRL
jgi:hypothetical protein